MSCGTKGLLTWTYLNLGVVHPMHMFPPTDMANLGLGGGNRIFIRYAENSKGYVFIGQEDNGGMTEFESRDVTFLENKFPRQGEISTDLSLFEMQDQNDLPHSSGRILGEDDHIRVKTHQ